LEKEKEKGKEVAKVDLITWIQCNSCFLFWCWTEIKAHKHMAACVLKLEKIPLILQQEFQVSLEHINSSFYSN